MKILKLRLMTVVSSNFSILSNQVFLSWIGIIIAAISAIAGIYSVLVAKKIYRLGIKTDQDRIIKELGVEFTMEYIIPFRDLMVNLHGLTCNNFGNTNINAIFSVIKARQIVVNFYFWNSHKGNIYEIFYGNRDRKLFRQIKLADEIEKMASFMIIERFVKLACTIDTGLKVITESMAKYLNENENKSEDKSKSKNFSKNHELKTMNDYLRYLEDLSQVSLLPDDVKRGLNALNAMVDYINNLPPELRIKENTILLGSGTDIPKIPVYEYFD